MSANSNFVSTQKIPQEATELVKLTKVFLAMWNSHLLRTLIYIDATFAIILYIL
jgi:hypothetical protein